jgi:hypothetical protein
LTEFRPRVHDGRDDHCRAAGQCRSTDRGRRGNLQAERTGALGVDPEIDSQERTDVMKKAHPLTRVVAGILMVAMMAIPWSQAVMAAPVGTGALLGQESTATQASRVGEALARDDVTRAMISLGVDPAAARERVASLTPAEVAALEGELERLPAGGGLLEVVGIVFVVLIILDLVGVTNVFTRF